MISRKLASSFLFAAAVAGSAFFVDKRADQREEAAEAAFPPMGQFVEVDGKRVHAVVMGQGRDVVLIHGAGGSTRDFTFHLARRLAEIYRVTVFDRPGMGYSDDLGEAGNDPAAQARQLQAAAHQLRVTHPIVLGHSYGGAVAMAWALDDPGYTDGLVIVSGATMPFPGDLALWYKVTGSPLGAALVSPLLTAFASKAQAETSIEQIFAPEVAPQGYADYIGVGLTLRRASLRINGAQVLSLKPHLIAMAPRYPSLEMPVEILHGTADTTVPPDIHAVPLSKILPHAHLTLIEGAGHMPHHTHENAVMDAIARIARR
ncbi:alpha/beta fold hydrolase [Pseudorhodobacter sp.]|uniref:alpha/beta fold hydrolase n=1 Tax=Pseudorhodobacter sp. TaxID=1934400 RepID=UPI002649F855|nr:alpha/beta hydrolase [Pseudorhodobacter sp.]MDN5786607.1 alpha/beta hydrolase [Pseudorhodobacter sp.]